MSVRALAARGPRPGCASVGRRRRWPALLATAALAGALAAPTAALAAVPTNYFTLGTDQLPVPAPAPFLPVRAVYAETFTWHGRSLGPFQNIQDLRTDCHGDLWVADTNNNRIVELDPTLTKVLLVIGGPTVVSGPNALNGPQGVAVTCNNGLIYVADTGNSRLAVFLPNGQFLKDLQPLNHSLTLRTTKVKFVPTKVAVEDNGTMYVAVSGQAFGLAQFSPDGTFEGFFAPNNVGFNLGYHVAKLLESSAQRAQNAQILPPEVNNVLIGPDGYIYTTSVDTSTQQIRRLNDVGSDNLNNIAGVPHIYGLPISALPYYVFQNIQTNLNSSTSNGGGGSNGTQPTLQPLLVSLAVDRNGIITTIDQLTQYVYQYGPDGQLLYTFGGLDNGNGILGLFEQVSGVAVLRNGDVVVADALENNLTVFKPTTFAVDVQRGVIDYHAGRYQAAIKPWEQAIRFDTNYDLAHDEIGAGLLAQGEALGSDPSVFPQELAIYSKAIHQFYLAADKQGFGQAFAWYRHIWMRMNFTWVFLTFLGVWLAAYLVYKFFGRYVREHPIEFYGAWVRNQFVRMWPMCWRMLKHPAEAFFQLKYENQGTLWQGLVLIGVAFLFQVLRLAWTDFDFNPLVPGRTNLLVSAGQFLLPLATWMAANFMVGDMYDGEASLAEVVYGSAYALTPFIALSMVLTLLSHVLAPSDGFYPAVLLLMKLWTAYLFFTQVRVFHNLEYGQAFKASLVTLVGIGVLWTMFLIGFGLGTQVYRFVSQIIQEIILLRS